MVEAIERIERLSLSVSVVDAVDVEEVSGGDHVIARIRILASAPTPEGDFHGHTISPQTKVLPLYPEKPIPIYWNHNYDQLPIGHAVSIEMTDQGILADAVLVDTSTARDVVKLIRAGTVWGASVGFFGKFSPIKNEDSVVLHIDEMKIVEISLTTMPVNPKATILDYEMKAVVPYQDWPIYPDRKREWDADEAEARWRKYVSDKDFREWTAREWREYRRGFILYDAQNPHRIGSYKLPIVDVIRGKPYAIWRAITAAANALANPQSYRGRGLQVFDRDDVAKARRHIARYYKKAREVFDDPTIAPPWIEQRAINEILKILSQSYNGGN